MLYTIAKIENPEDTFMNAFGMGGATPGLNYFCTEMFETPEEAEVYIQTKR